MRALWFAWMFACGLASVACDADGLCYPAECDGGHPCEDGRQCAHGVCITPCDTAGGCADIEARCIEDGDLRFCADADGLPVEACVQ